VLEGSSKKEVIKMPGPLLRLSRDPNRNNRGPGLYYHRGKGVYSKYTAERDSKIKARGYNKHKVGITGNNKLSMKRQAHDGVLNSNPWLRSKRRKK